MCIQANGCIAEFSFHRCNCLTGYTGYRCDMVLPGHNVRCETTTAGITRNDRPQIEDSSTTVGENSNIERNTAEIMEAAAMCAENTGKFCSFPFVYRGASRSTCISNLLGRTWCSTTENYDLHRMWGYCVPCSKNPWTGSD